MKTKEPLPSAGLCMVSLFYAIRSCRSEPTPSRREAHAQVANRHEAIVNE